ncbi:unnamed protein product [Thelazia callipaeda]|uniref:Junctophilin n=1 Tax=Thelazia callipaeda TaxID=103827 RepID=A0A158RCZ2_THECL|nr:unnamed protein product [Thelazia callipaeda]
MNGGRFDFDDGGTYCGGWEEGKAHGHGICTGPQGKGEYAGAWHYGFEVSGVYTWPSGNTYQGQWQNGKRHGLGVEQRGRWIFKGEWTQGYKGRYGHRQSMTSQARYQGTWSSGFHDGYGTEIYVDGGAYQGQWLRGMRHGYGIRKSAQHGVAAKFRSRSRTNASLTSLRSEYGESEENEKKNYEETDESRGGFVLKACSDAPTRRRSLSERSSVVKRTFLSGLRIKKQHSTGDIHQRATSGSLRSSGSTVSCTSDESEHRQGREQLIISQEEHIDPSATEVYKGEWKNDKRCGFGVGERSDGLKYEGEWFNNRKCGYGITTFKDGRREEGKYKNNVLICSNRKKGLLFVRSSRLKERVGNAVEAANRAATIAQQKADIAVSRTATAKERSEQADYVALQAREDADIAGMYAKQFSPEFRQSSQDGALRVMKSNRLQHHQQQHLHSNTNHVSFDSPPASKSSHESRDLSDELVVLNSPSLPGTAPVETNYAGVSFFQQPSNPGEHQHFPVINPGSSPEQAMSLLVGNNSGTAAYTTTTSTSNTSYQQQQSVNSAGYTGPTSYQVLPSSSYNQVPLATAATAAYSSGTPLPVVQMSPPYISSSSSYLSNAVPPHFNPNQLSSQQYHHHKHQLHLPPSNYANPALLSDHHTLNFHSEQTPFEQSVYNMSNVTNYNATATTTATTATTATTITTTSSDDLQQRRIINGASNPRVMQTIRPPSKSFLQSTNTAQSSSRISLSDDHYDQYTMSINPSRSSLIHRNRPSLTKQPFAIHDISQNLYRRSTLASANDKRLESVQRGSEDGCGSLPNLAELENTGVQLRREEAARLASQQRQELQRLLEEEQLLRSNPLRYLFHPAFKAWIVRWKLPLVLSVANIFLLMVFYNLLTYEKRTRERR